MILLTDALKARETPLFQAALKQAIEALDPRLLPLQQGLRISSQATDQPVQAMVIDIADATDYVRAKVGIFYTGVIAGCNCADDPSPIDEQNEYCVMAFLIDTRTAETSVTVLPE